MKDLQKHIPEFDWQLYLKTILQIKLSDQEPVVSYAMSYFTQLGDLLKRTDRRYNFSANLMGNFYILVRKQHLNLFFIGLFTITLSGD